MKLLKEPDNEFDKEAIQVKIKGLGKVGYVANSPFTVDGGVVCKITDAGLEPGVAVIENDMKSDNTLYP